MKTNEDEVLCTEPVCTQTERYNQIKEPNNPFSFWTSVNQDSHCTIEHQLSENRPITHWKPYINCPGITTFRKQVSPMPYYSTQQNCSQMQSTLSLTKRSVNTVRQDVSKDQHMCECSARKTLVQFDVNDRVIAQQATLPHKSYYANSCCIAF